MMSGPACPYCGTETTADKLRRIANEDIGGNAPWLADELHEVARKLELEWSGTYTGPAQVRVMSGQEAGLERLRQDTGVTGKVVTKYGQLDKNGAFLVWDTSPEGEADWPVADRIRAARSLGGITFRCRVIPIEDWTEVTEP